MRLDGSLFGTDMAPAPLNPELGFADDKAVIDGLDRTYSQGIELSEYGSLATTQCRVAERGHRSAYRSRARSMVNERNEGTPCG